MNKLINIGSLNIEHVYHVPQHPQSGERYYCEKYQRLPGGKGYYQSLGLARAGATVWHVGFVGWDGLFIRQSLQENNVNTEYVYAAEQLTGQENIIMMPDGQKSKVRYMGANGCFEAHFLETLFQSLDPNQMVLIQNEINDVPGVIELAKSHQLNVTFHPAPFSPKINDYPLQLVDTLILNQRTGTALTQEKTPEKIINTLRKRYPEMAIVLTLGANGALYVDQTQKIKVPGDPVHAIDENQAGNTFVGYYLAEKLKNQPIESCVKIACRASALCVTREGKSATIPYLTEIK